MKQIFVFLLALWMTPVGAQSVESERPARGDLSGGVPLAGAVRIERPAVFTDHRLTGRVDPGKKRSYNESIEGQPVSRPFPTMHPILRP